MNPLLSAFPGSWSHEGFPAPRFSLSPVDRKQTKYTTYLYSHRAAEVGTRPGSWRERDSTKGALQSPQQSVWRQLASGSSGKKKPHRTQESGWAERQRGKVKAVKVTGLEERGLGRVPNTCREVPFLLWLRAVCACMGCRSQDQEKHHQTPETGLLPWCTWGWVQSPWRDSITLCALGRVVLHNKTKSALRQRPLCACLRET